VPSPSRLFFRNSPSYLDGRREGGREGGHQGSVSVGIMEKEGWTKEGKEGAREGGREGLTESHPGSRRCPGRAFPPF